MIRLQFSFVLTVVGVLLMLFGVTVSQLPSLGAGALLHPSRRQVVGTRPSACRDATFAGDAVDLKGWRCPASSTARRGTLVYLHGIADARASGAGVVQRFSELGFDAIAYDSRAHG